jgi:hypothetical protein
VLCELGYEGQLPQGLLVYGAHGVVHQHAAQEGGQGEECGVLLGGLKERERERERERKCGDGTGACVGSGVKMGKQ